MTVPTMNKYTVYFEIFGKKMKHDVEAISEADAKRKVADKIVFHKVVKRPEKTWNGVFEELMDLVNIETRTP